jgi:hypothetical protein
MKKTNFIYKEITFFLFTLETKFHFILKGQEIK